MEKPGTGYKQYALTSLPILKQRAFYFISGIEKQIIFILKLFWIKNQKLKVLLFFIYLHSKFIFIQTGDHVQKGNKST